MIIIKNTSIPNMVDIKSSKLQKYLAGNFAFISKK